MHGHNGYLDIAVSMGIPALICAIFVIIIMPLVNYLRCRPVRENLLLADFFLMIVFFGTLNAMLESFSFVAWTRSGLRLSLRFSASG